MMSTIRSQSLIARFAIAATLAAAAPVPAAAGRPDVMNDDSIIVECTGATGPEAAIVRQEYAFRNLGQTAKATASDENLRVGVASVPDDTLAPSRCWPNARHRPR